ncbi:MAG: hypothetical protein AVO34_13850 [Firmicutes bacterium ML8_F2]|jgi:uncharacterized protein|nr:MAG: hypothetical protein AVO34_13850 [Firmicutes bacterium ML8_F2]
MLTRTVPVIITLILSVTLLLSGCGGAQVNTTPAESARVIQTVGEAELKAPPDLATISLAIETRSNSASDAVEENAMLANAVHEALLKYGLSEDDIKTGSYSLYSYRDWYEERPMGGTEIITYQVTNEIIIKTGSLDAVGEIIDLAVKAGANNIKYVNFELKDPQDLLMQALGAATVQAQRKAEAIAESTGDTITGLQRIREERTDYLPFRHEDMILQEDLGMGMATPIIPDDVVVRATVIAEYLIK